MANLIGHKACDNIGGENSQKWLSKEIVGEVVCVGLIIIMERQYVKKLHFKIYLLVTAHAQQTVYYIFCNNNMHFFRLLVVIYSQ